LREKKTDIGWILMDFGQQDSFDTVPKVARIAEEAPVVDEAHIQHGQKSRKK
jgi:hypothetical protein